MRPSYSPESVDVKDDMPQETRLFSISGGNKGLLCPFKPVICQEGFCHECQIYLDWQRNKGGVKDKGLIEVTQYD